MTPSDVIEILSPAFKASVKVSCLSPREFSTVVSELPIFFEPINKFLSESILIDSENSVTSSVVLYVMAESFKVFDVIALV